jgi:hypothetical protein
MTSINLIFRVNLCVKYLLSGFSRAFFSLAFKIETYWLQFVKKRKIWKNKFNIMFMCCVCLVELRFIFDDFEVCLDHETLILFSSLYYSLFVWTFIKHTVHIMLEHYETRNYMFWNGHHFLLYAVRYFIFKHIV